MPTQLHRSRTQGATVLLHLAEGTRLKTLTGERAIAALYIGVDEPESFIRAVMA